MANKHPIITLLLKRREEQLMNGSTVYSSTLFAMPSALSGFARVLDVAGLFDEYNTSNSDAEADGNALANDWRVVGDVLREAMKANGL